MCDPLSSALFCILEKNLWCSWESGKLPWWKQAGAGAVSSGVAQLHPSVQTAPLCVWVLSGMSDNQSLASAGSSSVKNHLGTCCILLFILSVRNLAFLVSLIFTVGNFWFILLLNFYHGELFCCYCADVTFWPWNSVQCYQNPSWCWIPTSQLSFS